MNLKPNKHKIISFNTTTMALLGFITSPPQKILSYPLNLAPPKIHLFAQVPPKIKGGRAASCYHDGPKK